MTVITTPVHSQNCLYTRCFNSLIFLPPAVSCPYFHSRIFGTPNFNTTAISGDQYVADEKWLLW